MVGLLGQEVGIEYRFDRALRVNTADAHRLIAAAGSGDAQARWRTGSSTRYFTKGADLSDRATLVSIAGDAGMDTDVATEVLGVGGARRPDRR